MMNKLKLSYIEFKSRANFNHNLAFPFNELEGLEIEN